MALQPPPSSRHLIDALAAQAGDDPVRLRTLALALAAAERNDEALEAFERAVVMAPRYAEAWTSLALFLLDLGRGHEAIAAAREATLQAPDDKHAWHSLGVILHRLDRADLASEAQMRAAIIDPSYRDAWRWLGFSRENDGDIDGAIAAYETAQALHFEPQTALHVAMLAPFHARDMTQLGRARQRLPQALDVLASSGVSDIPIDRNRVPAPGIYAYWGHDDRVLHEAHAGFLRRVAPDLQWTAAHVAAWKPAAGLVPRLAVITRYTYPHTIDRLFGRLLRRLPSLGFDVRVFTTHEERNAVWDEMEASGAAIDRLPRNLTDARLAIADFAPDIVFYPELGLDQFVYGLGFSRLAPLQIVTWGHAATSGLASIDCFVSDALLDPLGNEANYTEELVRLPAAPVRFAPPTVPQDVERKRLGLPENATLYVCVQSLLKLRPDFDAVLAGILARDSQGLLVLPGAFVHQSGRVLRQRLAAAIPDFDKRVVFTGNLPADDFSRLILLADAILDTPHFSGGVTAYETLGLGRGFVTLPGAALKGRVGAALYTRLGVTDLIARDLDHYVELAHRLANDPDWRTGIEARIARAMPALFADESGIEAFGQWLHARLVQMGQRQ